jgi:hypothetical protein
LRLGPAAAAMRAVFTGCAASEIAKAETQISCLPADGGRPFEFGVVIAAQIGQERQALEMTKMQEFMKSTLWSRKLEPHLILKWDQVHRKKRLTEPLRLLGEW